MKQYYFVKLTPSQQLSLFDSLSHGRMSSWIIYALEGIFSIYLCMYFWKADSSIVSDLYQ